MTAVTIRTNTWLPAFRRLFPCCLYATPETSSSSIKIQTTLADDVDDLSIPASKPARSWPFPNAHHVSCGMDGGRTSRKCSSAVASDRLRPCFRGHKRCLCRCHAVSVTMLTPTCLLTCRLVTYLLTVTPPLDSNSFLGFVANYHGRRLFMITTTSLISGTNMVPLENQAFRSSGDQTDFLQIVPKRPHSSIDFLTLD